MVEDDVFSFVTFEVLSGILEYLNTVVLEETFLRYMMEGFIEYDIHDDKCFPHVESELVDVVGRNSEHPSFMNCSVAFSMSIDVGLTIGYRTSQRVVVNRSKVNTSICSRIDLILSQRFI
jgi:hypothetical protein